MGAMLACHNYWHWALYHIEKVNVAVHKLVYSTSEMLSMHALRSHKRSGVLKPTEVVVICTSDVGGTFVLIENVVHCWKNSSDPC